MKILSLSNSDKAVLVDDEDFDKIQKLSTRWYLDKGRVGSIRSTRKFRGRCLVLARFILNVQSTTYPYVDHINGDIFDNRKEALRLSTFSQNGSNRKIGKNNKSGFLGVHFEDGMWTAAISKTSIQTRIGRFNLAEEAALAYNEEAIKLHGSFAKLNKVNVLVK